MKKTYPSLNNLQISSDKPTLICDADEVIFDFMHDFELFLKKNNLFFNWKSYALTGNILKNNRTSLNEDEIKDLINKFFKKCTLDMKLVRNASKTLNTIANKFNIIILSNIPFEFYNLRLKALKKNNLNFPFFANKGEKGTPCSNIFKINRTQTWFIDDSPYQVSSVKGKEPNIKTILFIENSKLARLVKDKDNYDFYSTSWSKNKYILLNKI